MVAFDGSERCRRAEAYYHDYLQDDESAAVPSDVTDHIRRCQYCRRRVEGLRGMLWDEGAGRSTCASARDWRLIGELQRHFELLGERLTCGCVRPFLAGLVDPAVKIRIPTPITVHVDNCPECARDLESLREGGQIVERADSGVITVCTIKEGGRNLSEEIEGDPYQGYPIEVKVLGGRREGAVAGGGAPVRRRRFKPFKRVAILAAALIPLAIMFSLTSPSATGLTVGRLNEIMMNVPRVHVSVFARDENEAREQFWIGHPEAKVVWQQGERDIVYDLDGKLETTVRHDGTSAVVALDETQFLNLERTVQGYMGLSLDEVPRNAELIHMVKESVAEAGRADVYKLTVASGEVWRVDIDPVTKRLRQRKFYAWGPGEEKLRLEWTDRYTYPDEDAFQQRVEQALRRQ